MSDTPATTLFRSRWVEPPADARELDSTALPAGFRAAGVASGIKAQGLDVGLLVSDAAETVSAARFTANALVAAPVSVSREADLGALRAVAVNSGNANVSDGERGLGTAAAQQTTAASALRRSRRWAAERPGSVRSMAKASAAVGGAQA